MRNVFFINSLAGKGTKQRQLRLRLEEYFSLNGGNYAVYETKSAEDAAEKARTEVLSGMRVRLFACGGEGTVFGIVNSVIGFENAEVGVIPCGSANDFLRFFDNSEKFSDISAQLSGSAVKMDLIKTDDGYCLNGCSVGMDAIIARDMTYFKRLPLVGGSAAYKLSIAKAFLGKVGVDIKILIDGKPAGEGSYLFAAVANAPFYGGGYKAAPRALPYDGVLDFTTVKTISKLRVPKFLSLYQKGRHEGLEYCSLGRCRSLSFKAEKPIPVNLDGEIIERCSMTFSLVEKALNFVLPAGVTARMLTNV